MGVSLRLTGRGWVVLLCAVLLGAGWWILGLRDIWYLAATLAATVILSIALVLLPALVARFRVRLTPSTPTPSSGERFELAAEISHRLPVTLRVAAVLDLDGEQRTVAASVRSRPHAIVRTEWTAPARGPATARVRRLLIEDPLGLARALVRSRTTADLLVLPRLIEMPLLPPPLRTLTEESDAERRSLWMSASGYPGGAVRDYRSGDALRQVHWKQSARQGHMLVNLPEAERETEASLMLVTSTDAYQFPQDFETAVSVVATLGSYWLAQGRVLRLSMGGQEDSTHVNEDTLLRTLALVATGSRFIGDLGGVTGQVTVVTGALRTELRDLLTRRRPGILITTRTHDGLQPPAGWRHVPLSAPGGVR